METAALNLKAAKETTFVIAPAVTLRMRVVLHPSLSALRDVWEKSEGYRCNEVLAFCHYQESGPKDDTVCTLNFQPDNFEITTISHEATHAILLLGRCLRLNIEHGPAEEILAEAMETILLNILKFKREWKASTRR